MIFEIFAFGGNVPKKLDLLVFKPKQAATAHSGVYLPTIVIFTPKSGLFDATPPS
jgi:hypothetical protein